MILIVVLMIEDEGTILTLGCSARMAYHNKSGAAPKDSITGALHDVVVDESCITHIDGNFNKPLLLMKKWPPEQR